MGGIPDLRAGTQGMAGTAMLKWDTSDSGVQTTVCKRWMVVRATHDPPHWIAYECLGPYWREVAVKPMLEQARQACEQQAQRQAA